MVVMDILFIGHSVSQLPRPDVLFAQQTAIRVRKGFVFSAMASDAKESESSKDVKQTQSSVAFTFDFGDSADVKPVGRLPPLIVS